MPVSPTYPGIYIEELPSSARTITAAPTSITVFVGYTHPFKTRTFGKAVRIGSYTDYEREFGGLYSSATVDNCVAYAVNQFFLNGGSDAYVVGLQPMYRDGQGSIIADLNSSPPKVGTITAATVDVGGISFTALEPTDRIPMIVTVSRRKSSKDSDFDVADIIVAYGTRAETFSGVTIDSSVSGKANFIEARIGTTQKPVSSLVTVAPKGGTSYGSGFADAKQTPLVANVPEGFATTFSTEDFKAVFAADSSLDKVPIFNILAMPGVADNSVWSSALAFAERKQAFVILDPPANAAADGSSGSLLTIDTFLASVPLSANGALYFPYLQSQDPLTGQIIDQPPSGYVAGIYARTDLNRGVWKAPAGQETTLRNTTGLVKRGEMTDFRQGILNPLGINVLRSFPGAGTVVFGARTLVTNNDAFQQWRYIPVRRMALFIEQTLYRSLNWAVFEPNDEPLWVAIRTTIDAFMLGLFNQGAFQGRTPSQAFLVKCDASTTTQADIDNGIVNVLVGFRPLKPAEFVIIKIAQLAGQVQS